MVLTPSLGDALFGCFLQMMHLLLGKVDGVLCCSSGVSQPFDHCDQVDCCTQFGAECFTGVPLELSRIGDFWQRLLL